MGFFKSHCENNGKCPLIPIIGALGSSPNSEDPLVFITIVTGGEQPPPCSTGCFVASEDVKSESSQLTRRNVVFYKLSLSETDQFVLARLWCSTSETDLSEDLITKAISITMNNISEDKF